MSFSKPSQSQINLATSADGPTSPLSMRTIRKIQSQQTLSSNNNPASNVRPSRQHSTRLSAGPEDLLRLPQLAPAPRLRTHRRARSNSDASPEPFVSPTLKRPARKTGSGFGVKRSVLESLLRDGPQNGNVLDGMQELRYLILSTRVDADADGMVCEHSHLLHLDTDQTSRRTESTSG